MMQTLPSTKTNYDRLVLSPIEFPKPGNSFKTKPGKNDVFKDIFKMLVQQFEESPEMDIEIMSIAKLYNIQHRKVYDFFGMLTYFGVCKRETKGKITWITMNNMKLFFIKKYEEIEIKSVEYSMKELFALKRSPSLGHIASLIVSLFMFLGVEQMNMKQVLTVFTPKDHIKTIIRRLYLVLNWLEIFGIITHTKKVGEYQLLLNYKMYDEEIFQKRLTGASDVRSHFVEFYLNRYSDDHIKKLREDRFKNFTSLIHLH